MVIYNDCSFRPDPLTNMAVIDNYCFWLVPTVERNRLRPLSLWYLFNIVDTLYYF